MRDPFSTLGLVRSSCFLSYGHGHGFGLWLPLPIKHLIVRAWNHVACRIVAHDDVLWHIKEIPTSERDCVNCCQHLTACTGYSLGKRHSVDN